MTNYNGQDVSFPEKRYKPSDQLFLSKRAAFLIRQELDNNPRPAIADLVMHQEERGVTVEFDKHEGLIVGYDDIVGCMNKDAASDNPLHQAFAKIVARSIPIQTEGDGR